MENTWRSHNEAIDFPGYIKIDNLYRMLEEIFEDLFWIETTLEALEWVLGETDVRLEIVIEEENKQNG